MNDDKPLGAAYNYAFWCDSIDYDFLKKSLEKTIIESGHTIKSFSEEFFSPHGYTACFVLMESHAVLHSYDEEGVTYGEITSCSKEKYDRFVENIKSVPFKILKDFKLDKSYYLE